MGMVDAWTPRILHLLRFEPNDLDELDHQQICKALEGRRKLEEDHAKLRRAFDNLCRIVDIDPPTVELYLGDEPLTDERVASAREDLRTYQDALASLNED